MSGGPGYPQGMGGEYEPVQPSHRTYDPYEGVRHSYSGPTSYSNVKSDEGLEKWAALFGAECSISFVLLLCAMVTALFRHDVFEALRVGFIISVAVVGAHAAILAIAIILTVLYGIYAVLKAIYTGVKRKAKLSDPQMNKSPRNRILHEEKPERGRGFFYKGGDPDGGWVDREDH